MLCPLLLLLWFVITGCGSTSEDNRQGTGAPAAVLEFPVRCLLTLTVTETDIMARVTIENAGQHLMKFLKWNVPADGMMTKPLFDITHEGVRLPYTGKEVKRDAPQHEDYLTLKPGDSATTTLSLKQGYNIREPGRYVIRYRGYNPLSKPEGPEEILSNLVAIMVQPWAVEDFYMHCVLEVVGTDNDIVATVTIENATQRWPIKILQEDLPSDGILTKPLFLVERNSLKVPFARKSSKRPLTPARPADYLTLRPGDETTATIPLRTHYDFSKPGQYTIRYKTFILEPNTQEVIEVISNPVTIDVR